MDLTKKDLERMLGPGNVVTKKTVEKMAQECLEWQALAEAHVALKRNLDGEWYDGSGLYEPDESYSTMHEARRAVYGALEESQ